jgi:hypothetical protein
MKRLIIGAGAVALALTALPTVASAQFTTTFGSGGVQVEIGQSRQSEREEWRERRAMERRAEARAIARAEARAQARAEARAEARARDRWRDQNRQRGDDAQIIFRID